MDSQVSTPRKYDDDLDYWVNPFRMPSRRALREAAGRTGNPGIKTSPRPMGQQNCTPSKQDANVGAKSIDVTSCIPLTEARQSRDFATIGPKNGITGKQDIDRGPSPLIMPSRIQRTAASQSLIIRFPLPQGILGLQNGASSKSNEDINSSQFQRSPRAQCEEANPPKTPLVPSRAGLLDPQNTIPNSLDSDLGSGPFRIHDEKARQSRSVPVLPRRRMRPANHLDVLRPNPFRLPSRAQREAVFKAAKEQRALESCTTSPFARLPAEIRLIIYEYALASRFPVTPRLNGAQEAEAKEAQTDAAGSSAQANASSLALLQTCWLMNREARPVYYASNTFRFTSAKDLVGFLQLIGPSLLNELRKLHIEGLLTFKPTFTEEYLETQRTEGISDTAYHHLASLRTPTLGADAKLAASLLKKCKRLHRIHFAMGSKDEMFHIVWLEKMTGYGRASIEFVDGSHWALRSSASIEITSEWFKVLTMALADPESRRALFPDLEEGQQRCIDVDIDKNLQSRPEKLGRAKSNPRYGMPAQR